MSTSLSQLVVCHVSSHHGIKTPRLLILASLALLMAGPPLSYAEEVKPKEATPATESKAKAEGEEAKKAIPTNNVPQVQQFQKRRLLTQPAVPMSLPQDQQYAQTELSANYLITVTVLNKKDNKVLSENSILTASMQVSLTPPWTDDDVQIQSFVGTLLENEDEVEQLRLLYNLSILNSNTPDAQNYLRPLNSSGSILTRNGRAYDVLQTNTHIFQLKVEKQKD